MIYSSKKTPLLLFVLLGSTPVVLKGVHKNNNHSTLSHYTSNEQSPFGDIAREYMKNQKVQKPSLLTTEEQEQLKTDISEIPFSTKCGHLYGIWQQPALFCTHNSILDKNGWQNLELLSGSHDGAPDVAHLLDQTETIFGKLFSTYLLTSPTSDTTVLQNRQAVIKEFLNNKELSAKITESLKKTAAAQNTFFFLYEDESDFNFEEISKYFFTTQSPVFKYLKYANTSSVAMELLCLKGRMFSYALPAALPYLFFWTTQKIHENLDFQKTKTAFSESEDFTKMSANIAEEFRKNKVSKDRFIEILNEFYTSIEDNPIAAQMVPNIRTIARDNGAAQRLFWANPNAIAQACTEGLINPVEQNIITDALKKSFGNLPQGCEAGLKAWNAALAQLTNEYRKKAAWSMVDGLTPWQRELKNTSDVEQIEITRLNPELTAENPEIWIKKLFKMQDDDLKWLLFRKDVFTKYTAGDRVKLLQLARKKCAEQSLVDQSNMSPATMNGIIKALTIFTGTVGAVEGLAAYCCYSRENSYNTLTNYLQMQMIAVGTVVRTMKLVSEEIKNNPVLTAGLDHSQHLTDLFDTQSKTVSSKLHQLANLLLTNTFSGEPSYFSFKGRVLAAYALMKEIRQELAPALFALGEVDAYLSCAKLMEKHENKENRFTFATYVDQDAPYINLQNMWHPFVSSEKAIANSIELGGQYTKNIILTGPNAGGKSTFSKGLATSLLLAQTIGIVPAQSLVFTPFAKINTYMNITDDTAAGNSLFKSEVLRAQQLLETINTLDKNKFSFSVIDEMFSGTSPKEGEAASYAVAKNLATNSNSIAVIATHFPKLKELETTLGTFKNYQVRVIRYDDGSFSYPFKLEEGAADQNVALDILQQQGFDSSILDDAQAILRNN